MSNKQIPQERWIEFLDLKYSNKRKVNLAFLGLTAIALLVSACQRDTVAQDPMSTENSLPRSYRLPH